VTAFVEYRESGAQDSRRSAEVTGGPDRIVAIGLENLEPSTEYEYRVWIRSAAAEGRPFSGTEWRGVRTLRQRGDTVHLAFATDSHSVAGWTAAHCNDRPEFLAVLSRTLRHIVSAEPDFVVLGGDEVITRRRAGGPCAWGAETITARRPPTSRETHLRYRLWRELFAPIASEAPVLLTLGNHDGEAGFDRAVDHCGHVTGLSGWSRAARLAHLPNGADAYDGGADGNYFAFESGDALFVILDVMRYTTVQPRVASDWTLGSEQLTWLAETLRSSDKPWKLLFAHHLVGGVEADACYHYGRGGARATEDGTASGALLGEQRRIHELMRETGAQFFFYGHDHLFSFQEKLHSDGRPQGIYYVAGGVTGTPRARWSGDDWVASVYGDPATNEALILAPGFVDVTIEGERRVVVRYVGTALENPAMDGRVIFERVVERR
jgi:3',5'-cyclic AMP phosphodiesterase CpdA